MVIIREIIIKIMQCNAMQCSKISHRYHHGSNNYNQ